MSNPAPARDNPGVIMFPPLLYSLVLIAGIVVHVIRPWSPFPGMIARPAGAVLMVAGLALAGWGRRTMEAAGTNVNPGKPTAAIVTTGPFAYSRNPLYIAITLFYLGGALVANSGWPLLLAPPLLMVAHFGIVRREERYLEAKFGDSYRRYKARVRRWL